ncbi:MAG: hypothetical protein HQK89_03640 [Nitrospirae bacterium]|nr:hypothetical protein [Nitrospirota bacterium]
MTDSAPCARKKVGVAKFATLVILGAVVIVYSILLFTGTFGKEAVNVRKSSDPRMVGEAKNVLEGLLKENAAGVVTDYSDVNNYLRVKVNIDKWKKMSVKDKKDFLIKLAKARETLGLPPNVKVVNTRNGMEFASFENNRPSLSELEF